MVAGLGGFVTDLPVLSPHVTGGRAIGRDIAVGSRVLNFTAPEGGILDSNGVGTGFPSRLPGTAFSGSDTNLFVDAANGVLTITSTSGDYNGGANEPINESPGVALS